MAIDPADAPPIDTRHGDRHGDRADRGALVALVTWARDAIALGGRFGLSFRGDRHGRLYVAPWRGAEPFFTDGRGCAAPDPANDPALADFLARNGATRLSYGYPVRVDPAGMVTPLLYCAVETADAGGDDGVPAVIRKAPGRRPRLHHRPLAAAGLDRATIDAVVERVERGSYGSFAECLAELGAILAAESPVFGDCSVTPLHDTLLAHDTLSTPGWHDTAVLFVSPPSPAQDLVLDELARLEPAFSDAANPTALHALVAPRRPVPMPVTAAVVAPFPMTADIPPVLDSGLTAPLTAVEAPPGTGRAALLANLMASLVVDGQSVLYVSPSGAIIDQHMSRLQALLAKHEAWIPKLGGADPRDALKASLDRLPDAAADPAAPATAGRMTRQTLADLQHRVSAVQRRIEALRDAHHDLAARRRRRRALERDIGGAWAALLDPTLDWPVDAEQAARWRAEAERLAGDRSGGGFVRLLRRRSRPPMSLPSLRQSLAEALAPLPTEHRDPLLAEIADAEDPEAAALLAEAFDRLACIAECRRAAAAEHHAAAAIEDSPGGEQLAQDLAQAQSEAGRAARALLAETWQAAITAGAGTARDRLDAAFDGMAARQHAGGPQDRTGDAALGRLVDGLTRPYPLWTALADAAPQMLPLIDGLFDVVIIDDADRVTGAALLGLLLRGRRAVVIGSLAEPGTARTDAFTLAASAVGAAPQALAAQTRSHPDIVRYLSEVFHDGVLRAQPGASAQRRDLPPEAAGIHWHQPRGLGPAAAVAGAVELVRGWHERGLFGVAASGSRSIGVTTPLPAQCDALRAALTEALPPAVAERVAVAPPDRFAHRIVDLLVILPDIDTGTPPARAERLASSRALYHEAIAAVRLGVHVIGDLRACRRAGGFPAALLDHRSAKAGRTGSGDDADGGAHARLADLLAQAGLPHARGPHGFEVIGRFGGRYRVTTAGPEADVPEAGTGAGNGPIDVLIDEQELAAAPRQVGRRLDRLV